jgi:hypothetical protein
MLGFNRIVYNSTGGSSISIGAVTTAERNCSQRRFFQPLNFDLAGLRQYLLEEKNIKATTQARRKDTTSDSKPVVTSV